MLGVVQTVRMEPRDASPHWSTSSSIARVSAWARESARCGFGSSAPKVDGSISPCSAKGRLVVNLLRHRVDTLIGSATWRAIRPGKRRHMKEWLTVAADDEETWVALARVDLPFDAELGKPPGPTNVFGPTRSVVTVRRSPGGRCGCDQAGPPAAGGHGHRCLARLGSWGPPGAPTTSFEAIHPGLFGGFPSWGTGRDHAAADPTSEPSTR
jgi:hypothetical protein